MRIEAKKQPRTRHPLYKTWRGMIGRCYDEDSRGYKYCGAKGVRVCSHWFNFFDNFVADMGLRPQGMFLGRVDSGGHYMPGNCRWVTKEQLYNRQPLRSRKARKWPIVPKPRRANKDIENKDIEKENCDFRHLIEVCRALDCDPGVVFHARYFRDRSSFAKRREVLLQLYRDGWTVPSIRRVCGLTPPAIRKIVKHRVQV